MVNADQSFSAMESAEAPAKRNRDCLEGLLKRLQLLEREFAFSKFTVEVLGGKVAASIASMPPARQAEVGAVAKVARGRIPFQNWVEPSMRRQGQLQPDAKGRDSLLQLK